MHIIMGKENATKFKEKYIVLELDTIKIQPSGQVITAYCVIENIPIPELSQAESMNNLHQNLLENYRKKNWNFCNQALEHLIGFWAGELDSFYADLQQRITQYSESDPGDNWDGIVEKQVVS